MHVVVFVLATVCFCVGVDFLLLGISVSDFMVSFFYQSSDNSTVVSAGGRLTF